MLALLNSKLKEYNIHGMLFLGWGLCDGGLVVVHRGSREGTIGWGPGVWKLIGLGLGLLPDWVGVWAASRMDGR